MALVPEAILEKLEPMAISRLVLTITLVLMAKWLVNHCENLQPRLLSRRSLSMDSVSTEVVEVCD